MKVGDEEQILLILQNLRCDSVRYKGRRLAYPLNIHIHCLNNKEEEYLEDEHLLLVVFDLNSIECRNKLISLKHRF